MVLHIIVTMIESGTTSRECKDPAAGLQCFPLRGGCNLQDRDHNDYYVFKTALLNALVGRSPDKSCMEINCNSCI